MSETRIRTCSCACCQYHIEVSINWSDIRAFKLIGYLTAFLAGFAYAGYGFDTSDLPILLCFLGCSPSGPCNGNAFGLCGSMSLNHVKNDQCSPITHAPSHICAHTGVAISDPMTLYGDFRGGASFRFYYFDPNATDHDGGPCGAPYQDPYPTTDVDSKGVTVHNTGQSKICVNGETVAPGDTWVLDDLDHGPDDDGGNPLADTPYTGGTEITVTCGQCA